MKKYQNIAQDDIKVSVITVCFNAEKTIEQTIKSVLQQTYKNIEYIIIDGNSQDKTVDIIKKYQDSIAYWISENDSGIYDAMNKGIRVSTGDIIGIINSDDWYDLNAIENVVNIFINEKADVVYGDMILLYENGFRKRNKTEELESLAYKMSISHPTTFVNRNIYIKYGLFDTHYRIAADYDLMLRLYHNGVVMKSCSEVIAYFRMSGVSNTNIAQCAEETRRISLEYLADEDEKRYLPIINSIYQRKMEKVHIQNIIKDILEDDISKALIKKYFTDYRNIYIFGAGILGMECCSFFKALDITIKGFIDNDVKKVGTEYMEVQVMNLADITHSFQLIIIAVQDIYQKDIRDQLMDKGYKEGKDFWLYYDFIRYFEKICCQSKMNGNV